MSFEDTSPKDSELIVVVMGQAGAGKSSFINAATGSTLAVGQKLGCCTTDIQIVKCSVPDGSGRQVVFVDTPAFDIDLNNDVENKIRHQIENWRKKTQNNVVAGIIYFHKISEVRINEPPLRRLKIFEKLYGGDLPENFILVTTMWNQVEPDLGMSREAELGAKYWKRTTGDRPNMTRFENEADSGQAWRAIHLLLEGYRGQKSEEVGQ